ncbi:type IV pilus assembly protein PilW [Luteibacter sp. UNC138MFCol5.1]|uniref:PilW family protein n=1 Tax=Luteibacter sp. UNC138MFCol5.1 TaxID=1502774 RepID=UPI0008B47140|nr:PilW family protein [Luteibacter sp. UNC138MFCol5.1]SEO62819.1 type IV pilus assembly protein PilW [Luteibacter sp. UNC138MFCol5.1]
MTVRTFHLRAMRGVTLIELMVALVLGLLVSGGIITLFLSTSSSNRVQTQLARIQEDGRFALGQLTDDLAAANGMYCNNTGGIASSTSSGLALDGLRTPRVLAKSLLPAMFENTSKWGEKSGEITYPAAPTAAYPMPSFMFMRGYNCTGTAACLPIPVAFLGGDLDTAGTAVGNRVIGTDVLTMRYLDVSRGWRLGDTSKVTSVGTALTQIDLAPTAGEPPVTDFKSPMALVADCSGAQVFAVTGNKTKTIKPDATNNFSAPQPPQPQSASRLYDFVDDMQTVTYYVQVVSDDGSATGVKTGALMRRVNGNTVSVPDQELVRGVERLTFRYGVEDAKGNVKFLTADQVDKRTDCPPTASTLSPTDPGCAWRAVKSIEVSLLLASQMSMPNLTAPETAFVYTPDSANGTYAPVDPASATTASLAIKPTAQGFETRRLRRQFTSLVMLRNYNP